MKISLTDFLDFVNKSGSSKMTKVRQVKNRDDYHPSSDFYKPIRDGIVQNHQEDGGKAKLEEILEFLSDKKKIDNYPTAIKGYQKFWGRKKLKWFEPPFDHWKVGDLDIKINPEVGLLIDGVSYVIKLYFKADKLTKDKIGQILSLMENQLRTHVDDNVIFAVLDVRNAKMHENIIGDLTFLPLLEGEARSFEIIWKAI
ncbi:hypothetical protein OGH69_08990 [Flavobacterium sp. MFBS3-15]|uniref:hypothetical protein n=1 Tax=Flavobacterium sp. MFBS3-15 TaxID=2989816 RepID=UPI0022364FE3|nr:hypothetical protein [Flavobacterium sp. MFBS3-15]MCW4469097.1 hypothetical protein [Flavobacterium sp. MFBS3-15]